MITATDRNSAFVDTVDASLALDKIAAYPFLQVREKILMEESISRCLVDSAIEEFRKYLSLIAVGNDGMGMISRDVDEVWHTFILFTADYAEFCADVFGHFIHHQPGTPSRPLGTGPRERFMLAYRERYGELPAVWGDRATCFGTCTTPSTNCQDPPCK